MGAGKPVLGQVPSPELNRRQIAAPVGVAPFSRESGTWKGKRAIGGSSGQIRSVLYMSTVGCGAPKPRPEATAPGVRAVRAASAAAVASRQRATSNSATATATETFNDPIRPRIGIAPRSPRPS